jgi:hypothetical protein
MAASFIPAPFAFVIDTDSYAGNFEREMCAFMTGMYGECGVGMAIANEVREQISPTVLEWFDEHVVDVGDDHGCHRPVSIWPAPNGDGYNSVAIFMNESPPENVLTVLMERARAYKGNKPYKTHYKITGFRVIMMRMTETVVCSFEMGLAES